MLDKSTANAARILDVALPIHVRIGNGIRSVLLCIDGKVATLLVRADQNEFQLAPKEVDITQRKSTTCR